LRKLAASQNQDQVMQRILDFFKRARDRINARIAILAVVGLIGTVAVWQGFQHLARKKPAETPTKQVAIGVKGEKPGAVQPVGASLTDEQMPGQEGAHQLLGAAGPAGPPPTSPYGGGSAYEGNPYGAAGAGDTGQATLNPYAPAPVDPTYDPAPGGEQVAGDQYAGNQYGAGQPTDGQTTDGQYGDAPAAEGEPTNPYRATLGDGPPASPPTTVSIGDSEPADSGPPGTSPPTGADPLAAYQRQFGGSDSAPPSTAPPVDAVDPSADAANMNPYADIAPPATAAPLGNGSAAGLATSPYGGDYGGAGATPPATSIPSNSLPNSSLPNTPAESGLSASPYGQGLSRLGGPAALQPTGPSASANSGRLAAAAPGERHLEGPQQPAVTIEKYSPSEIQVGKPATFELVVRNAGQVPAQDVVVTDHVPAGTQLVAVRPQPAQGSDGAMVWSLGTLQPGEERTLTVEVMPQQEGEIGSTAHLTFAAQATSRSICTRPQLSIDQTAPAKVLIGQPVPVVITVTNPGSGPATGVVIEEDVPEGFVHAAGSQLEYAVGTLRPMESRRMELSLRADKAGLVSNRILVRGEGGLQAEHTVQVEVVAPLLEIDVNGPKKRFLERQATYTVSVANPGTASARDVELVATLPRGMKFVEADSQGQYDPTQHAVFWSLEELPPTKAGSVRLTTVPIEPGNQQLRVEAKADLGLAVAGEQLVEVMQSAELLHTVKDADDVIEIGSETSYIVKVSNVGTKAATNVRVVAILPPEIQGTAGEGPTKAAGDASRIEFEPLATLNPQEEVTFKVIAKGVAAGDHIVRVQLSSDEWPNPVTREESTRVYEDR
jgi:uncharacterized repeat protein (TIGR01451 family)